MACMISSRRVPALSLTCAIALSVGLLSGCGSGSADNDTSPSATGSSSAEQTATLKLANGQSYTVNLAPGVTEPIDIFGNDGGEPVGVWGAGFTGGSEVLQITSQVGDPFAVELPQSASTGYVWQPTGGSAPGTVVELVEDFVLAEGTAPGSPGTHYFVYRSSAAGTGTLVFSQYPPGSQQPSATVNAEVSVTE